MDSSQRALERRVASRPGDPAEARALAERLRRLGQPEAAYKLVWDAGLVAAGDPSARALAAELFEPQRRRLRALPTQSWHGAFELAGPPRWMSPQALMRARLPVTRIALRGTAERQHLTAAMQVPMLRALHLAELAVLPFDLERLAEMPGLAELHLYGCDLRAVPMPTFAPLRRLEQLSLCGGATTSWEAIGEVLPELTELSLRGAPIRDLRPLTGLRALRRLNLSSTFVDDPALRALLDVPSLASLELTGAPVSERALAELSAHPGLRQLALTGSTLHPRRLARLSAWPELRALTIPRAELGRPGWQAVFKLPALESLGAPGSDLNQEDLAGLSGGRVRELDLRGCQDLHHPWPLLHQLEGLESLAVSGQALPEALPPVKQLTWRGQDSGFAEPRAHPLESITLQRAPKPDDLSSLARLPRLTELHIEDPAWRPTPDELEPFAGAPLRRLHANLSAEHLASLSAVLPPTCIVG